MDVARASKMSAVVGLVAAAGLALPAVHSVTWADPPPANAPCTITGTSGPDTLTGTPGSDVICGRDGDDILSGLGGDDLVRSGGGDDTVNGGAGADRLVGNGGDDELTGGGGADILRGQAGVDVLIGSDGDDDLSGGVGGDDVRGGAGVDRAGGYDGDDTVNGGAGNDEVLGGDDVDWVLGSTGADRLHGGPGDDLLNGGADNDDVRGGVGDDTLLGSTGDDLLQDRDGFGFVDRANCGDGSDRANVDFYDTVEASCEIRRNIDREAPVAVDDVATVAEDDPAAAVDVLANDTDADGGPKKISSVSDPGDGTAVVTGNGAGLTYQPDAGYCNDPPGTTTDDFTYTLAPGGSTATVAITVTCGDVAPTAVDDSATVDEDDPATTIDVLANDTDPDGGPISIASVTAPSDGEVLITNGGADLTYEPDPDFCNNPPGTTFDTFTYSLAPGGSTATVTVTVDCVTDPAVAADDTAAVLEDDPATTIDALGNDTAGEGGALSITSVTQPGNGTVEITNLGADLTYEPDANYCNDPPGTTTDDFTYTVDPGGDTATVFVTVSCVNDAPVADDELFTDTNAGIGNTVLVSNDPTDGAPTESGPHKSVSGDLLAGDTDLDSAGPLTITPETVASVDGGSAVIEADGDFVFTPAAGTSCTDTTDSFDYTVGDGDGGTDIGTVTVDLTGCVWYVRNNAAAGGGGTSNAPFDTLAEAETASGANHTIFVFDGDNTSTGYGGDGLVLKSGQRLIGERHGLQVGSDTLLAANSGARPTLTASDADVVSLDDGNVLHGLRIEPSGTGGGIAGGVGDTNGLIDDVVIFNGGGIPGTQPTLELDGTNGSFGVTNLSVTSSGATGVRLNNAGTVEFGLFFDGSTFHAGPVILSSSGAKALDATSTDINGEFAQLTVNGSSSGGVSLSNTTGSNITFGSVAISTSGGDGFAASSAGTLRVTGAGNTIASTNGTALRIVQTTIALHDLNFESISASNGSQGIVLDSTGSLGNLVVTGNGGTCTSLDTAGCTGGTIEGATGGDDSGSVPVGTGIVLKDTVAPSLTRLWIKNHSNYGVRGTNVSGLTLANSVINGDNGTNGTTPFDDSSLLFNNLTGSVAVTDTHISGGFENNMAVVNTAGSLDRITLNGVTFGVNGARPDNDALLLEASATAGALKATITDSTFSSAAGDLFQLSHGGSGAGDLVLTGSTFSNSHPSIATGGGGLSLFQSGTTNTTTMEISDNTFRDAVGAGLLIAKTEPGSSSTQSGTFTDNTIGVSGVANSGSAEGSALKLQNVGGGSVSWTVDGNQIFGYNNFGIEVLAGGANTAQSGAIDATITNNTIAQPGNTIGTIAIPKQGVHLNIGTQPGDSFQACADIKSNTLDASGADSVPSTFNVDVRLRQRQATTIRLPGYGGANNDNDAVQAFVNANNSPGTSSLAANTVPTGGGFVGGAACSTPALP